MAVRASPSLALPHARGGKKLTLRSTISVTSSPRLSVPPAPLPSLPSRAPTRLHALVHMTHTQTRRSTRRSLANEQGVENDLSNRVGRAANAAASTSLAVGKPPAQKPAASTSTLTVGTRRTATSTRAALGDKVRLTFALVATCARD